MVYPLGSRGLPMIFMTVHNSNEQITTPWGKKRGMGIYRKLLQQDPQAYTGHVTIFREDGTRVSYRRQETQDPPGYFEYKGGAGAFDHLEETDSGWFEKTKEGIYYEYNTYGNLKRIIDSNRNQHYYVYDSTMSDQKLTEIKAHKGLRPYFYYDDPMDPTLVTRIELVDPNDSSNDRRMYFKYNSTNLEKITGPEGCQWYYEYDVTDRLTKITDPDNYSTDYVWDAASG